MLLLRKKVKKIYPLFLLILCCALLTALSMWQILLQPGVIGHNWDAPIPAPSWYLRDIFFSCLCSWEKHYLGGPMSLKLWTIIPVLLYSFFGLLGLSGQFACKILLFFVFFLSMLSMAHLAHWSIRFHHLKINNKNILLTKLIAATAYVLSPFFFNIVIGGAFVQYITLIFLPLGLKYIIRISCAKDTSIKDIILLSLVFSLVIPSAHNFVLLWSIFLLFCLGMSPKKPLPKFAVVLLLTLLLNCYLLLPLLTIHGGFGPGITHMDFTAQSKQIINTSPQFFKTLFGAGYNNRHFFLASSPAPSIFYISSSLLLILIVLGYWPEKQKQPSESILLILFILSVAIAACGQGPFAPLLLLAYNHLPLMHIFRSTQRLMVLPTLFFPLILTMGLTRISISAQCTECTAGDKAPKKHYSTLNSLYCKLFQNKGQTILLYSALGLILLRALPFWSGEFGRTRLASTGLGVMDNYQLPPDYITCLKKINQDHEDFRTAFLPISISPYYLKTKYQLEAQGGDPLVQSAPHPAIFAFPFHPAYPILQQLTQEIYGLNDPCSALEQLCKLFSAKYVLLRNDVWDHGPYRQLWIGNCKLLALALEKCQYLTPLYRGQYCSLFKVRENLPLLNIPQGKIYVWDYRNH